MSDEAGWVSIPNWRKFQHYQDGRQPPWLKMYAALLDNDDYLGLSLADRGLLHDLWKLTSRSGDGRLSADRVSLARKLSVRRVSLEPLIQAGFVQVRSRRGSRQPLAQNRREETRTPQPPTLAVVPAPTSGGIEKQEPRENAVVKVELPASLDRILTKQVRTAVHQAGIGALVTAAWKEDRDQVREAMLRIEQARDPAAMFRAIAKRIVEGAA